MPYVAVDEARKALVPQGALSLAGTEDGSGGAGGSGGALKSFDFVVYGRSGTNLLVDIKGRRVAPPKAGASWKSGRLESWVTLEDVDSLERWQALFGSGFSAAFVFIYWCDAQPPDALFQEIIEYQGSWYALRAVPLQEYKGAMKTRSERWKTVHVPTAAFERISQPFAPASRDGEEENGRAIGVGGTGRAGEADWGPDLPVLLPHESAGYHRS